MGLILEYILIKNLKTASTIDACVVESLLAFSINEILAAVAQKSRAHLDNAPAVPFAGSLRLSHDHVVLF